MAFVDVYLILIAAVKAPGWAWGEGAERQDAVPST